jgi:hypothetical protein
MKPKKQKQAEALIRRRNDLARHNDEMNKWSVMQRDATNKRIGDEATELYQAASIRRLRALNDIHNLEAKLVFA